MTFKIPEFNFNFGEMTAYDYQQDAFHACLNHIRESNDPAFVYASVSAGKSLLMAMIAKHFQNIEEAAKSQGMVSNYKIMIIARQGELAKQDSDEAWSIGVKNSVYSASINKPKDFNKLFPVVCATEGTVYNELHKALGFYVPTVLLIDECLTGDSMIETEFGKKRIDSKSLINDKIKCIDERTGNFYYDSPVRVFSNGIKSVSSIKLSDGTDIKCTGTHKLFSSGSWIRAKYLSKGSLISVSASQDFALKKLLRASAAVARKLIQTLTKAAA